jgi:hypothetical protein
MTEDDKRRERRQRVLKGATIIGAGRASGVPCTVRNMHAHGAELRVDAGAPVPERFLLYVPVDGIAYRCELRWRQGERCGVAIAGREDKPAGQY